MALTTTVSGASSDSYATVVEADSYVAWKNNDAWENATEATKEGVLKAAVAVIDELLYEFPRADTDQALRFPTTAMLSDGSYYVPERVKRAQAYLALHMLNDPDMFSGSDNVKQVSVPGAFSVTMGGSASGRDSLPEDVERLLDRYFYKGGPTTRYYDSARRGFI